MRIAYFSDTYLPQVNGVTNTLSRLVAYLKRQNIENIVFAPGGENDFEYHTAVDTSFSIRFFLYPECRLTIPNIFRLRNVLDNFRPDLIHLVTPFNLGLYGLKYGKDHHVPVVASYHTNFDQYLEYYNLPFLQNLVWDYFSWFHNQCLVNYGPSRDTLGLLEGKGIQNLKLWGRGVDTVLYDPQKRKEEWRHTWGAGEKLVLLYVGRLAPEKNLDVLLKSFRILLARHPHKLHLVITGDGPLAHSLQGEGLQNVSFTGYKKGEELAEIFASADIFAFPSSTETFGNVVLEAMASGLPVVGVRAGGVQETIHHGENGLLCSPNSVRDFTEASQRLIADDHLRSRLGQGARAYALSQSWENIFHKLVVSYRDLLYEKHNFNKSA